MAPLIISGLTPASCLCMHFPRPAPNYLNQLSTQHNAIAYQHSHLSSRDICIYSRRPIIYYFLVYSSHKIYVQVIASCMLGLMILGG